MSCAGADGTCEKPAKKSGYCWGHWKRKMRGRPLATPLAPRSADPVESLFRAFLAYRDELDTATNEEFARGKDRVRFQLREYLWRYVPRLIRRHRGVLEQPGGVEKFLASFGDKASHSYRTHSKTPPTQYRRPTPQQAARKATR